MKQLTFIIVLFISCSNLFAQTEEEAVPTSPWIKGGRIGLNLNQSTLSNWAAGGASSVSGNAFFSVIADYKDDKQFWNNSLDLGYGLLKEEDSERQKTEDKIVLMSSYGRQLSDTQDKWFYSAALDFRTQFDEGFDLGSDTPDKPISDFMAPAYMLVTLGLDWKPVDYFSVKFGVLSSKMTFVLDDTLSAAGAFGVEPGDKFRFEGGGTLVLNFNKEIFENVTYISNLTLFSNYEQSPDKIDVNWENTLNMKINKFLTANIYNQLIYDYDVKFEEFDTDGNLIKSEERVQFKNILGLGIAYNFGGSRG